jgi:hypothetical protein
VYLFTWQKDGAHQMAWSLSEKFFPSKSQHTTEMKKMVEKKSKEKQTKI